MKLGYTILYVPDVMQAIEHYERCFGISRRFVDEGGTYGELDTGATALAFVSEAQASQSVTHYRPNTRQDHPAGIEVAFITEDVATAFQQAVDNGALAILPPTTKPWGQVIAYVRDLNGVLVEIGSEMS